MLLVDCTVILSFWCILYSFFAFSNFLNSVFVMLWPSRRGLCKLVLYFLAHRLVCASFFSQLSHFPRSSFCLHKDSTHNCNAGSQQWSAQPLACPSLRAACHLDLPSSVAGLSAANSPAPASPKEGERGLSRTDGERLRGRPAANALAVLLSSTSA